MAAADCVLVEVWGNVVTTGRERWLDMGARPLTREEADHVIVEGYLCL